MKHIGEPVRNFYRKQGWEEGYKAGNGILVQAVESAKAAERERIIKLLKGEMCEKDAELVECWCGSWLEAIALINGENK